MDAKSYDVRALLRGGDQFVIPLFQRKYVWDEDHWNRLWDDLTELLHSKPEKIHFLGSMVFLQLKKQPGMIPRYLVIDGQQRLTTIVILLCAIRDRARELSGEKVQNIATEIQESYLLEKVRKDVERYRILPRTQDRNTVFSLLDQQPPDDHSRVAQAYNFFLQNLRNLGSDKDEIAGLNEVYIAATERLSLVVITLTDDENPFEIFETLNSTGLQLEEADLIRNYIFMKVRIEDQDSFDTGTWQPFEKLLNPDPKHTEIRLTSFYRDFLMRSGEYVGKKAVYQSFVNAFKAQTVTAEQVVQLLLKFGKFFRYVNCPDERQIASVRRELKYLRRLNMSTANPLLLCLLERHGERKISDSELCITLRNIQSFVIRRAILGERTRGYGYDFPEAVIRLDAGDVIGSLNKFFQEKGWPKDEDFTNRLAEFPLYRRASEIAQLLLIALEESFGHKEPVNVGDLLDSGTLQIEHVMPQTIADDQRGDTWRKMLGGNWLSIQEKWLHTVGNLTLSGYNRELSNSDFYQKKTLLEKSNLQINRYFSSCKKWDEKAISARAIALAGQAAKFWPVAGTTIEALKSETASKAG